MLRASAVIGLFLATTPALGQTGAQPAPEPPGIQDNSFLVEEAYNQDPHVVQHINSFSRSWDGSAWNYTFTQEWPLGGQTHQLSGTFPFLALEGAEGTAHGLGDLAVNYRYQWIGDGEARVACAPRLSLLLPTGSYRKQLGAGGLGLQASLPLSVVLAPRWVTHGNLGATFVPSARSASGERAATRSFNLGWSLIRLAQVRLNLMLETVWARAETAVGAGLAAHQETFFLSPGIRWSYNFKSGLQIVPGVAFPIGLGPSKGDNALFLYLSFEHPFGKPTK